MAFLKLLRHTVGTAGHGLPEKYLDLVMKCLWKVIKFIPDWMKRGELGLGEVLGETHEFLKAYPSTYWKRQASDIPMRTVKTLLHSLVSNEGVSIIEVAENIPNVDASELVPYLKKLVAQGVATAR